MRAFKPGSAPLPGRQGPRQQPPPPRPIHIFGRDLTEVRRLHAAWAAIRAAYRPPPAPEPEPVFPDTPEFRKAVALLSRADRPGTTAEGETALVKYERHMARHKLSHALVEQAARRSR